MCGSGFSSEKKNAMAKHETKIGLSGVGRKNVYAVLLLTAILSAV